MLTEAELNLGLKTGGTKERDLEFVKHRYDIIIQKKELIPELQSAFELFNFSEELSLALVKAIVGKIGDVDIKSKIAKQLATELTVQRRDFLKNLTQ